MKEIVLANPIFMDTQVERICEKYDDTGIDELILSRLANYKFAITENGDVFEIKVRNDKTEHAYYGSEAVKVYCKLFDVDDEDLKALTIVSIDEELKSRYTDAQWKEFSVLLAELEESNSEATWSMELGYPMSAVARICMGSKLYVEILSKRCSDQIGYMI